MVIRAMLKAWTSSKKDLSEEFTGLIKRIAYILIKKGAITEDDLEAATCLTWHEHMSFNSTMVFLESQIVVGYEIDDIYKNGIDHVIYHAKHNASNIVASLTPTERLLLQAKYGV
jgi:hypothetical protein